MTHKEIKETILEILGRHLNLNEYEVFLFGSRAKEKHRQWSDYDVGVTQKEGENIPFKTLATISQELEESNLPVNVDVVDFNSVDSKFRELALKNVERWK